MPGSGDAVTNSTTASSRSAVDWLVFGLLGFMWGSSYLFIKIGVNAGLHPFTLVMFRLLIGSALLWTVVLVAREKLPREPRFYAHISVVGFFGIALPFVLITFAEGSVDSALAAVLTAPVPLFVIPFAALLLPDEGLTANKVVGVLIGLIGVAVLVGFDPAQLGTSDFFAEILLVGAAISYAIGGVYARRFVVGYRPMIPALFEVFTALLMVGVLAFVLERPLDGPFTPEALVAVTWLGLVGSGLAFLAFFRLLGRWGAARTSLVAYLLPVWGIILGALVLHEEIPPALITGTALIIGGIALVNYKRESLANAVNALRVRYGRGEPATDPAAGPR
jgi:drug/metabolite transporter (DMT)-like permease